MQKLFLHLYNAEIQSIIVEGGTKTINHFLESNLWDEAKVYIGNTFFYKGIEAPKIAIEPVKEEKISDSKLITFRNENAD